MDIRIRPRDNLTFQRGDTSTYLRFGDRISGIQKRADVWLCGSSENMWEVVCKVAQCISLNKTNRYLCSRKIKFQDSFGKKCVKPNEVIKSVWEIPEKLQTERMNEITKTNIDKNASEL